MSRATHWRDGMPRLAHTLVKAAAAESGIVEEEIELLRVHLETALLLNCMLLAAADGSVTGDALAANYHFAWFQRLSESTVS